MRRLPLAREPILTPHPPLPHQGWKNHTDYLNAVLGWPDQPFRRKNKLKLIRSEAEISPATIALLQEMNSWDLKLYDHAVRLTEARLRRFEETGVVGRELEELGGSSACKGPVNDPLWTKDGKRTRKPNPDSYLFTRPYCEDNSFHRDYRIVMW
jgi:hypothetical protein